jgi:hypothetical protein
MRPDPPLHPPRPSTPPFGPATPSTEGGPGSSPRSRLRPAAVPVINGLPVPGPFRQIPPRASRPGPEEDPVDHQPLINPPLPCRGCPGSNGPHSPTPHRSGHAASTDSSGGAARTSASAAWARSGRVPRRFNSRDREPLHTLRRVHLRRVRRGGCCATCRSPLARRGLRGGPAAGVPLSGRSGPAGLRALGQGRLGRARPPGEKFPYHR